MNKQKFVEYLRSPESISASQFEELEQLLVDYPYFSIAKSVAARASKNLNSENKNDLIASAAIYATDRRHLKRYVNGEVIFLADTPNISPQSESKANKLPTAEESKKVESPQSGPNEAVSKPTKMEAVHSDVDQILDELQQDMEELRKSRLHFVEIQNQLDDEGSGRAFEPSSSSTGETEKTSQDKKTPTKEDKVANEAPMPNITNLIDSLKKEFAEEDDLKPEPKPVAPKSAEKDTIKPEKKAESKKIEDTKKEPEPTSVTEDTKQKEDKKEVPRPPKKERPAVVTNMDDTDEDEETTVLDPKDKPQDEAPRKKVPARANRGARQKVKREDLEKLMGIAIKPAPTKKDKVEDDKTEIAKKESPLKKADVKTEGTKPVKKETAPKAKKEATTPKPDPTKEELKPPKIESPAPSEEVASRSSARAFLDFGGTGDMSSSVSRASSSRRKRGTRSSKSNGDSGEKKGGDDDDKSGPKDLIEKFITENPSIQRRTPKGDKSDLSEKSTEWQPDIASEYLAEIYLKQGNKPRAIQIYEALMLKFPEKKSYFAALIEKVQG